LVLVTVVVGVVTAATRRLVDVAVLVTTTVLETAMNSEQKLLALALNFGARSKLKTRSKGEQSASAQLASESLDLR
jgi:hypothetical protein